MPDDTRTIYERIDAARQSFPPILKTAEGQVGTRHYNYADINAVVAGVEGPLREQGIGIFPCSFNGQVTTELRVLTDTAQSISASLPLPPDLTPQQTGSAITYFRRYLLVLLLNLLAEDDDGGAASNPVSTREVAPEAQADAQPVVPEGWDNYEQAANAHVELVSRIQSLHPDFKQSIAQFRAARGWPLSVVDFDACEELVRVAEGLSA